MQPIPPLWAAIASFRKDLPGTGDVLPNTARTEAGQLAMS